MTVFPGPDPVALVLKHRQYETTDGVMCASCGDVDVPWPCLINQLADVLVHRNAELELLAEHTLKLSADLETSEHRRREDWDRAWEEGYECGANE